MRALITGGTGLVGRALVEHLPEAVVQSRDPDRARRQLGVEGAVRWDPTSEPAPREALEGVDVVFNLAGEPVAERRPALFPVPEAALRLAFGEMSGILTASQRVLPRVAERTGYAFKHPSLDGALAAAVGQPLREAA